MRMYSHGSKNKEKVIKQESTLCLKPIKKHIKMNQAEQTPESTDVPDFNILLALFGNHLGIDDLRLHFVRAVQRPGFIYIPAISSDPFLFAFETLIRRRN